MNDAPPDLIEPAAPALPDEAFDHALIAASFMVIAGRGWPALSVVAAAQEAGLDLSRARLRFADRAAILRRLGAMADAAALEGFVAAGSTRDALFDLLMRRFDAMLFVRPGLAELLRALPLDPAASLLLLDATARSAGWLLEAVGVKTSGWRGALAVQGLSAAWLYAARVFATDESEDLSATMAALDRALAQAERAANWLAGSTVPRQPPQPFPEDEPFEAPPA